VFFNNGVGNATFTCTDAALGSIVLTGESVSISTGYTGGNGTNSDPNDNSARFSFSNSATTWGVAQAGAFTTTMALSTGSGVTIFEIGNQSRQASTFTNTTSGGTTGTAYNPPTTDAVTGALLNSFVVSLGAFVDAGGFTNGASNAMVSVTFTYNVVTPQAPEPVSMVLVGGGLLGIAFLARRRFARK
jgi:hypothetical protein